MTRSWIPPGVTFCDIGQGFATEHFTFVLLPGLSMNAFSSAIEPLRIANQVTGRELFHWRCLSEDGAPVRCSNGIPVGVDGTLEDITPDDIVFVCSGVQPEQSVSRKVADTIRHLWRRGQTVGGICTGTYTLAHAGILQGSAFTMHWENIPAFRELYPRLETSEKIFVFDKRIWTCAGGFAATDMMVHHIHGKYGKDLATTIANMCLYPRPRSDAEPQKASIAATVGVRHPGLIRCIEYLENNLEEEIRFDRMASELAISRRQLERLFSRYLGTSPAKYLMTLRLHRARSLLSETGLGVADVVAACGFNSPAHFSKRFREMFGVSPHRYSPGM